MSGLGRSFIATFLHGDGSKCISGEVYSDVSLRFGGLAALCAMLRESGS
jgi:hypothetical protein